MTLLAVSETPAMKRRRSEQEESPQLESPMLLLAAPSASSSLRQLSQGASLGALVQGQLRLSSPAPRSSKRQNTASHSPPPPKPAPKSFFTDRAVCMSPTAAPPVVVVEGEDLPLLDLDADAGEGAKKLPSLPIAHRHSLPAATSTLALPLPLKKAATAIIEPQQQQQPSASSTSTTLQQPNQQRLQKSASSSSTSSSSASTLRPEVVEQLACLAANVTLRLVGTRWRIVMQQQQDQLMIQTTNPLPAALNDLGGPLAARQNSSSSLQHHDSLLMSPALQMHLLQSASSASPASFLASPSPSLVDQQQQQQMHPLRTNSSFLTIPNQHLALPLIGAPMTPPTSPPKNGLPTATTDSQKATLQRTLSRNSSTSSVSSSVTATNGNTPSKQQQQQQQQQPLPPTYLFHYAGRLRAMVNLTLTRTRAPPQTVPYALLLVQKLVSLRTLPEALATPTRLLLAALMIADVMLRDATTPIAAWAAIAKAVGAGVEDRKGAVAVRQAALDAVSWRVGFVPGEFEGWLERLKGWVSGVVGSGNGGPQGSGVNNGGSTSGTGGGVGVGGRTLVQEGPVRSPLSVNSISCKHDDADDRGDAAKGGAVHATTGMVRPSSSLSSSFMPPPPPVVLIDDDGNRGSVVMSPMMMDAPEVVVEECQ